MHIANAHELDIHTTVESDECINTGNDRMYPRTVLCATKAINLGMLMMHRLWSHRKSR